MLFSDAAPQQIEPQEIEVLIAEDSLTQAMKLQFILEERGYQVTHARHGKAALEILQHRAPDELPTLVITDVQMPQMNGYDLCRAIKSSTALKKLPVILLTSLSDPADVVHGMECGADNFIIKPYDEASLLARLDYILANQKLREETSSGDNTEVFFAGQKHVLSGAPNIQTALDLLLGTYETAMQQNQQLNEAKAVLEQQSAALRQKNQHMEADLNLAREIQQAFILKQYPSFPHHALPGESAIRFYHRWIPTTTLGGDFFDVLALSETQAGVFICDVMGHGVRSALVTAMLRALVGERTSVVAEPGRFLTEINRHLMGILQPTKTSMFASAFYVVADVATGRMSYANAGHPSPILVRRQTGAARQLLEGDEACGPALGVFEDALFETAECDLEEGDFLMLFTDGLVEVESEVESESSEYGEARLLQAVQARAALPSSQLFDELLADIQRHAARPDFEDDVCVVGMEITHLEKTSVKTSMPPTR